MPLWYTIVPPSKAFVPLMVIYVPLRRENMPLREILIYLREALSASFGLLFRHLFILYLKILEMLYSS